MFQLAIRSDVPSLIVLGGRCQDWVLRVVDVDMQADGGSDGGQVADLAGPLAGPLADLGVTWCHTFRTITLTVTA